MSRLFEIIKICDGEPQNTGLHEKRLNESRRRLFGSTTEISLAEYIRVPDDCRSGIYSCRVIYEASVISVEFIPYQPAMVPPLKLVHTDEIDYGMKPLEESVTGSLDGTDTGILKFLPYLLQDHLEIGSDPETMARLISDHIGKENLKVLDLGCGKGAVSVRVAAEPRCEVTGIDALTEFIREAEEWSRNNNVSDRCSFKVGDIRVKINELRGFDVVILGAIGPVFGNMEVTLNKVKDVLNVPGYVLLDDGYIEDDLETEYDRAPRKSEFFRQIDAAGFTVVKEEIFERDGLTEADEAIFSSIKQRADELKDQYPELADLFQGYVDNQAYENRILETVITTGTWLLRTRDGRPDHDKT